MAPSPPWPRKPEASLKSSWVSTSTLRPDLSEGGRGGLGERIRDKPRLFKCYQPLISLDAWEQDQEQGKESGNGEPKLPMQTSFPLPIAAAGRHYPRVGGWGCRILKVSEGRGA